MRRLVAVLVAALGVSVLTVTPAHAAAGCINGVEFDLIEKGWTRSQVEVMIGADADYLFRFNNATTAGYNHCGGNTQMMAGVTFRDGIEWRKEWAWREL